MLGRVYLWTCVWTGFAVVAAEPEGTGKGLPITEIQREARVDFEREILPILKDNCLACHGEAKPKGGLVLETPARILKGGDSGPAVIPGKGAESLLLKAAAHLETELIMPPRENKVNARALKPEELGLLKLWIEQGATGQVSTASTIDWQPLPDSVNPIYALALTSDGQLAACGRANQIYIYHLPARRLVARLVDPQLTSAAHRDLVHSLAFSPDDQLLASGGYREVKLWHRPAQAKKFESSPTNSFSRLVASIDGQWLVTADTNGLLTCWETAAGKAVGSVAAHTGQVAALSFSIDGKRLATGGRDKRVRLWTVPDLKELYQTNQPSDLAALAWVGDWRLALAGDDPVIRVYAVTNGVVTFEKELKGHQGAVTALHAGTSNSTWLGSGSADGSVRLWDVEKAESIRQMEHGAPILAVAIRPDGRRLASAGTNGAKLWNAEDGKLVAELRGDRRAREALAAVERDLAFAKAEVAYQKGALEAAEKQMKTANERLSKAVEGFAAADKASGEKQSALKAATEGKDAAEKALAALNAEVQSVTETFAAAEKTARQAAVDAKVALEKAAQAKLAAEQAARTKLDTERIAVDAAALAEKTRSASSGEAAEAVKAAAEKMAAEAAAVAEKAKVFAQSVAADAAAKEKAAVEAKAAADKAIDDVAAKSFALGQLKPGFDKTTAESPEKIKQASEKVKSATNALMAAEKELAKAQQSRGIAEQELQLSRAAAEQGTNGFTSATAAVKGAEAAHAKSEADLQLAKQRAADSEQPVRALAFSGDNQNIATTDGNHKVHTWNAESGTAFESYQGEAGVFGALREIESSHAAQGKAAILGVLSTNGQLVAWDLNPPWSLQRTLGTGDATSPLVDRVNAVRFSADGAWLATGGGEPSRSGEIKIWRVVDRSLVKSFGEIHSDAVLALDFSPDGKHIASGAADKFVRIVQIESGQLVRTFEGHTHHVLGVSWKRDGRTLASSGADNVLKVWDFVSGERKKNIEGFSKEVTSVAFVGMDQALASSGDTQVRLVKENGENVRTFGGPEDFVYSAAATPDGKIVVAGGQDSTLRVWDGTDGKALMTFPPEGKK